MSKSGPAPPPGGQSDTETWVPTASDRPSAAPLLELELEVEEDPLFASDGPEEDLPTGYRIGGYEVSGLLGRGGMATVYRARDLDQPAQPELALKVLRRRLGGDPRHLQRFRQEARLAARLRHPRIVGVLAYGESGGRAWLAMPLVEGASLDRVVAREGPFSPGRAAQLVADVARAVDAAHAQRVVHRDLKPANIVLHADEGPLVLDFGLAKQLGGAEPLTATGEILGTPATMAPEQIAPRGAPVDHRVDVYALGAVLHQLLVGELPYAGASAVRLLQRILHEDPPRLRSLNPALPAALEAVVAKAMARHPDDRYPTAGALADDLERFVAQQPVLARLPGWGRRLLRRARAHPVTSGLVLALALVLLLIPITFRVAAHRLARRQRAEQALAMLQRGLEHAGQGSLAEADGELLQAMLVAKGAFLEDPGDPRLRAALIEIKRARVEYAELLGRWTLAAELRANLERLERGDEPAPPPPPDPTRGGLLHVEGLGHEERVLFEPWQPMGQPAPPAARREEVRAPGRIELRPGAWRARHLDRSGQPRACYLVVVGPGEEHQLRLGEPLPLAPGLYPWPLAAEAP